MNPLFDPSSPEYNHVMQILNACKCLFVSHRKIAIYLQSLNAEKKKKTAAVVAASSSNGNVLNETTNTINNNDNMSNTNNTATTPTTGTLCKMLSSLGENNDEASCCLLEDECGKITTTTSIADGFSVVNCCKLVLSDIRIPLSWKYSDHLKASKNSGNLGKTYFLFNYHNFRSGLAWHVELFFVFVLVFSILRVLNFLYFILFFYFNYK